MLHSHKSENGDIIKINIPYVEDFLDNSIHDVYNAAVHQLPYKMGIAFGFMLLDTEKTTVRHWYVDEHLTRTPQNKDILHQVPNLFVIKNKNDANTVIEDLYKQNYFDLVRRMLYSYRVHILRITNMKVSIFKMNDDKMDDVGGQSSEDESSDDEGDDDDEEDFEDQSDIEKNDFLLLEAEDDDDGDDLDEDESDCDVQENVEKSNFKDSETEKDLKKIRSFLKTGLRTNKIFKGLKRELQRNVGGVINDNICFFSG